MKSRKTAVTQSSPDNEIRHLVEGLLDRLARARRNDTAEALDLAQEALSLARRIGWREGIAGSLAQLGRFQEPGPALETILEARAIFRDLGDRKGEADALHNLGLIHRHDGHYTLAGWFYSRAYEILDDEETDPRDVAIVLANISAIHFDRGETVTALVLAAEAVAICRKEKLTELQAHVLAGTARALWLRGDHRTALVYASKSLRMFRSGEHDPGERGLAEASCSGIEVDLGNAAAAIRHGKRALKLIRQHGRRDEEAVALLGLGLAFHWQGSFDDALARYRACLQIATDLDDRVMQSCTLAALGGLRLTQGDGKDAVDHLLKAHALVKELDGRGLYALVHFGLYHAYKSVGNTTEALLHLERHLSYTDDHAAAAAGPRFSDLPVHDTVDRRRRREEICTLALPSAWHARDRG